MPPDTKVRRNKKYAGRYRSVVQTHTVVRRLATVAAAVNCAEEFASIGEALDCLKVWSQGEEARVADNTRYGAMAGKVTKKEELLESAAMHYLKFANALGLLTTTGRVLQRNTLGDVLVAITVMDEPGGPFSLTAGARVFFLFELLSLDADLLLTVLDAVSEPGDTELGSLQADFQALLSMRLEAKGASVTDESEALRIRDRLRVIANDWKNPRKYAEQIVPPRLAWLTEFDLIQEVSRGRGRAFRATDAGVRLVGALRERGPASYSDVTEDWLEQEGIGLTAEIGLPSERLRKWARLTKRERRSVIAPHPIATSS